MYIPYMDPMDIAIVQIEVYFQLICDHPSVQCFEGYYL